MAQSATLALQWFERAAEQGNSGAQIKLGYMLASGRAGNPDPETAYVWILPASLSGDARGDWYLPSLEKQLDAEQLTRAKEKAKTLRAKSQHAIPELAFLR